MLLELAWLIYSQIMLMFWTSHLTVPICPLHRTLEEWERYPTSSDQPTDTLHDQEDTAGLAANGCHTQHNVLSGKIITMSDMCSFVICPSDTHTHPKSTTNHKYQLWNMVF